jgi:hypothetical protein
MRIIFYKLAIDSTELPAGNGGYAAPKQGKCRLMTLDDIDRRTAAYAAVKNLIDELEACAGGSDRLSPGERQLIQRAAVLGALLEDTETRWIRSGSIDPKDYCTVINAQRRVLESIGLKRQVPRDVTPTLEQIAADIEAGREDAA